MEVNSNANVCRPRNIFLICFSKFCFDHAWCGPVAVMMSSSMYFICIFFCFSCVFFSPSLYTTCHCRLYNLVVSTFLPASNEVSSYYHSSIYLPSTNKSTLLTSVNNFLALTRYCDPTTTAHSSVTSYLATKN